MIPVGSAVRRKGGRFFPVFATLIRCLALVAYILVACKVWIERGKPPRKAPVETVGKAEIKKMCKEVKSFALAERVRAWKTPGVASRQAAANAAGAEYLIFKYKFFDKNRKPFEEKQRREIQLSFDRLKRARALSRLGAQTVPEGGGARIRAYLSEVDCSLQSYSFTVPKTYDPAVKWPLIISLHGHGWFRPYQGHPAPQYSGAFGLSPTGRGATDYRVLGENDILRCIAELKRDFEIDPDRIVIRGGSMGGTGALWMGTHYADQFSGLLPVCGNGDNRAWTERWGWNHEFPGRFTDFRKFIQEGHTARAFAVNLSLLPTFILHGSGDTIVPPEHSRYMVRELRALGAPVKYLEFPNKGHGGHPGSAVEYGLGWVCGQEREAFPSKVRWKADRLRHGKAYWIRFECMQRSGEFMEIDAQLRGVNRVEVKPRNLRRFSIQRDAPIFAQDKPLFVNIEGERVIFPPNTLDESWVTLQHVEGSGWRDAAYEEDDVPRKRPGLEGPMAEALLQPFVLVVGTQSSDPLKNELWFKEAYQIASEWNRRNGRSCPCVRDYEVTDTMIAERNLILLGGVADNQISKLIFRGLPIQGVLEDLPGGSDRGFFLTYPNPMNSGKLVVVWQASGPEAIYQGWGRFGNWFNWGPYDSKKYFDYAVYDKRSVSPETMLRVGWFGPDWNFENGMERSGVDELRAQVSGKTLPEYGKVPDDGENLLLMDLRPKKIEQMRGAIGFGRSFRGQRVPRSIGVRAPAFLEYDIEGKFSRFITGGQILNGMESTLCLSRERGERVRFVVKGDGKTLGSCTVSWKNPQATVDVDVTGVKTLRLECVPAGGPSWLHDGAAWLVPTLYR